MNFLEFYREHSNDFWRFLFRLSRNEEDTADAMQGAFERFLTEWDRGSFPADRARPVLFRLAYQAFVELHRSSIREAKKSELIRNVFLPYDESMQKTQEELEIREILRSLLESPDSPLTERQKHLLHLRVVGELRPEEILEILSITRQSYYRDIEKIRRHLSLQWKGEV